MPKTTSITKKYTFLLFTLMFLVFFLGIIVGGAIHEEAAPAPSGPTTFAIMAEPNFVVVFLLMIGVALVYSRGLVSDFKAKHRIADMEIEKRDLTHQKKITEQEYFKRIIDESMYQKIMTDIEEKLIATRSKLEELKKEHNN